MTSLHSEGHDHPDYQPVHTYVLNPKVDTVNVCGYYCAYMHSLPLSSFSSFSPLQSVSMGELYGEVNKLTLEWNDGLMAITVRHCVKV